MTELPDFDFGGLNETDVREEIAGFLGS